MSLVLIDVDDLKVTNDRDGHRSGDELLRFVANQLQGMVRAADAACRYGGDEFVVLLTTGDAAAAAIFAERLIELTDARSRELTPAPPWAPAKLTAGVAAFPADGRTVEDPAAHRRHPALPRQAPGWRPGRHRHTPRWRVRVVRLDQSDLGDSGCDHSGRVDDLSA